MEEVRSLTWGKKVMEKNVTFSLESPEEETDTKLTFHLDVPILAR